MRTYMGYDLIYSEDDGGWYAQDFSDLKQLTSKVYEDLEELKAAIRNGEITFKIERILYEGKKYKYVD